MKIAFFKMLCPRSLDIKNLFRNLRNKQISEFGGGGHSIPLFFFADKARDDGNNNNNNLKSTRIITMKVITQGRGKECDNQM